MMRYYFVIMGTGCLLYYGIIRHYTGKWNSTFAGFWLFAGLVHMGGLAVWKYLPEEIRWFVTVILAVGWILFFLIESSIQRKMKEHPKEDADYLIVLGAHVNGRTITKSLMKRLDAAYGYLCRNPRTQVIVSGGQGKGEAVSEADAMAENLLERGIGRDRIIREDRSTTTEENLRFSQEIIRKRSTEEGECIHTDMEAVSVVVATNNFHLYRALLIGRYAGYQNLSGLAAASAPVLQLNYLMREFFAIILTKVRAML